MKATKATPTRPQLAKEEWDFSACPPDQLRWCDIYEHARENQKVIKAVEHFRESGEWLESDRNLFPDNHYRSMATLFFTQFSEFPQIPFLKIAETDRVKRCALLDAERAVRVVNVLKPTTDR